LASIEDKLKTIDSKFRRGTNAYKAARYIVRQNRELPKEEEEALITELDINPKSLEYVTTKLRKLGLYTFDIDLEEYEPDVSYEEETQVEELEELEEISPKIPKDNNYATLDDLNSLRDGVQSSLDKLTSALLGETETEEGEAYLNDSLIEIQTPDDMLIGDPSLTRKSVWLKPKTQMYFDLTRQGFFTNYSGSNEISVLSGFKGNLSDFVNSIIDDYFVRNYNADIGILARRYI